MRASVVTWRLNFHMFTTRTLGQAGELLTPVADIREPDDWREWRELGLASHLFVEPALVRGSGEILLSCYTKAHLLMTSQDPERGWSVIYPQSVTKEAAAYPDQPDVLDGFHGVFNPTFYPTDRYSSPIPDLFGASFLVRVLPLPERAA